MQLTSPEGLAGAGLDLTGGFLTVQAGPGPKPGSMCISSQYSVDF